ncbi:MAG: ABC transporter substrate-binding protein [Lachnospiraceae bacterium]|nr:ABC transporter substrate-binding protein [Lachnospiraceae bacterium]
MKKIWSAIITAFMTCSLVLGLANTGASAAETSGEKILYTAADFAYASLDTHKDYYGWYTSIYGISETLFKMGDDSSVEPWLATEGSVSDDGLTWTITVADGAAFSNGEPVTADMVVRNLQRAAEVNARFAYLAEYEMEAVDEHTLTITTPSVYPTMQNDLASPELGILDLDNTTDFDNAPIATGPFVVDTFEPEGTVTVAKNENYWGGEVQLDGAVFYYMQDDDTKLAAMQSGEVDCYTSVTAAAVEIYSMDPDTYQLTVIPATRLQFYILNENTLDDSVREAINLTVDAEAIASYLGGTVSATEGPFSSSTAYGQVTVPAVDTEAAKTLLEADGYTLNGDGFYEKDGEVLTLRLYYYASRSLDTLALLMQEQLKNIGVNVELYVEEDPDATYISTGDFDIALYCMISDKAGDPYYFIDSTLRDGAALNCGGFVSEECESLINELQYETDTDRRAELANEIVQIAIDDNAFGYVGLFNKTTVMRSGVSGFAETSPFDFYAIDAGTEIAAAE